MLPGIAEVTLSPGKPEPSGVAGEIVLETRQLVKSFPGVKALKGVNIACRSGEVLALVGENGAGKSTLCNIIGGVLQPDSGQILWGGTVVRIRDPQHARKLGIAFVHQEESLLPFLTVGENIFLGHEDAKVGVIDVRGIHERARELLSQIAEDIDPYSMVFRLSPAQKQMVEIAKSWSYQPRLLILDEPTSSLSSAKVGHLMEMLRVFKARGIAIIFISHRLDEVFMVADRITVMKDGEVVGTRLAADITRDELIRMMVGREMTATFPPRRERPCGEPVLELRGASIEGVVRGVDLTVHAGEIVGLGGLEGQGQRELVRAIFGDLRLTAGDMRVMGERCFPRSPSEAIAMGIAFVSDDRKQDGLVLPLSVSHNMTLVDLDEFNRFGIMDLNKERIQVERYVRQLAIRIASLSQQVRTLSGGNQQKVVFGKWLMRNAKVLVLHEPTRGIDVQTKMDIYRLLRELAEKGAGILMLTSDMLELIGLCDRIYVMYEGRMAGEIPGSEATEERLMFLSSGGGSRA